MLWGGMSVIRPSEKCKMCCLRNLCSEEYQILWKGSYPPYFQIGFPFSKIAFIVIPMGRYRSKMSKTLFLPQLGFFFSNKRFFYKCFIWQHSQKLLLGILKFQFKFTKRWKSLLTWDPMGVNISKRYSSYSHDSLPMKPFGMFPVKSSQSHKLLIAILKFQLVLKKDWNLTLWPIGEWKMANIFWKWLTIE